jgi:hypothetical protein
MALINTRKITAMNLGFTISRTQNRFLNQDLQDCSKYFDPNIRQIICQNLIQLYTISF